MDTLARTVQHAAGEADVANVHLEILGPNSDPDYSRGSIFFVGTATVIVRYAGFTILTDPNFLHQGDHVHLGYGLRSRRLTEPALSLDQLPAIDFVVVSHFHGDHFDHVVAKELDRNIRIITTRHGKAALKGLGFRNVTPLDTWETVEVRKRESLVRITSMPGKHAPTPLRLLIPPVMGSMFEFARGGKVPLRLYVSGDTLLHRHLKEIPERYPDIDVGLFHLGGTRIGGILLTMDAKQGVEAVRIINPKRAIPIHYDDYTVFKSPLDDFRRAVHEAGLDERIHYLIRGESFEIVVPADRL